jgi:hypothetical protein
MTTYSAPIKDQQFILHEVLRLSQSNIPGYGDLDPAFTEAILNESGKLASAIVAPLNAIGDREGCTLARRRGAYTCRVQKRLLRAQSWWLGRD